MAAVRIFALLAVVAAACHGGAPAAATIDEKQAAGLFNHFEIQTDPGMSGLAAAPDGTLWAVSERGHSVFHIRLASAGAGAGVAAAERIAVEGVPAETDLESIAWLAEGRFAFGTESHGVGKATIVTAHQDGGRIVIDRAIDLPASLLGVDVGDNAGAEGLCGTGDVVFAAIETIGVDRGRRFAAIARVDLAGDARAAYRLWLTSDKGKLSSLDCTIGADGVAHAVGIERHFAISRILAFDLTPAGGDVTPTVVQDLGPILRGALNLEGLARLPDGRLALINDNHYRVVTGPTELLVFKKP